MKKEQTKAIVMTDEQIEQGLTLCSSMDEIGCKFCSYAPFREGCLCIYQLMRDSLAYIKRLKEKQTEPECFCTNNMPGDCDSCKHEFDCTNTYKPQWDIPYETKKAEPRCFCTNEIPETDCEGCKHVLDCTNTYGLED